MPIDYTALITTLIVSLASGGVVALLQWGANTEFKKDMQRRMNQAETQIKSLEQEVNYSKLTHEVLQEVKNQTNRIWEKLEKVDEELKEIYKRKP